MITILALLSMMQAADEPVSRYESYFLGRYAESGACTEAMALWMIGRKEVTRGPLTCSVREVSSHSGALRLSLTGCTEDGEARDARSYTLDLASSGSLFATGPFGHRTLRPCP